MEGEKEMRNPLKLLRKHLSKRGLENKILGKKENTGDFFIPCQDCGKLINIDETNCPKKFKKVFKRNWKMRGIASYTLGKMNPRCPDCQKKFLSKGGKDEEPKTMSEAIKKAEGISEEIRSADGQDNKPDTSG